MKITFDWLKDHLQTKNSERQLINKLTDIGLEVESIESTSDLDKFVIAKIIKSEKHPNADRLKVCDVDIGEKEITLNIALSMTALRGAAMLKDKAEFAYWVWVVDREKKVLTRNRTPVIAKFEGRDSQIDFSDIFDVIIPQRPDHSPPDWRIYIGLELTKEELAYNRRRLGSMRRR